MIALLAVGHLSCLYGLGDTGLVDETEPIFAETARQMLETGDVVTPVFNGATRFDKPPLVYWLAAAVYRVAGVSGWAARLPSALSALAVAAMIGASVLYLSPSGLGAAARWGGAFVAVLSFLMSPGTWIWGRTCVTDMLLVATLTGALLTLFVASSRLAPGWFLVSAALCGAATLEKGPVAPLLWLLIGGAHLFWTKRLRTALRSLPLAAGVLVFLVVAAPWYVLVTKANGRAFIDAFLGYHNLQRFVSVVNRHSGPLWFYVPVLVLGLLPWVVLLPRALTEQRFWARARWRERPAAEHLALFACFWLVTVFAFFTLAQTKLPSYLLPAAPAVSILIGLTWHDAFSVKPRTTESPPARPWFEAVAATVVCGVLAAICWRLPGLLQTTQDADLPAIGTAIAAAHLALPGAVIWVTAAAASAVCVLLRQARRLPLVLGAALIVFFPAMVLPAARIADTVRQQPLRTLAAAAAQAASPTDRLLMIGAWKPSVVFYSKHRVQFARNLDRGLAHLASSPARAVVVITEAALWQGAAPHPSVLMKSGRYLLLRVVPATRPGKPSEKRLEN